jgi:hypothetical protein
VLITDERETAAAQAARASGAEVLHVGLSTGNRAITCFTARRNKNDPAKCDVFVELRNHGDQTAEGKLELAVDDKPGPAVAFAIEKDGRLVHLFEGLVLPTTARLTAKITPGDAYPFDDTASIVVPAPNTARPPRGDLADMQIARNDAVVHPVLPHAANKPASNGSEGGLAALYRNTLLDDSRSAANSPMFYAEFLGPLYGEPNGVDIRSRNEAGSDSAVAAIASSPLPLWVSLAAVAAVLLVLEWCLCQRRWTC